MLGKKAPEFNLPAWNITEYKDISLSTYKNKIVVLIFYPYDFTFVCPTEILGFSKRKDEFDSLNATILFISSDSKYSHKAWASMEPSEGGIKGTAYPLLSDVERTMAANYKMLNGTGVCYRGVVILNKEAIVKSVFYYDDRIGRSVDEVLRVVKNVKLVDEDAGAFCPLDNLSKK